MKQFNLSEYLENPSRKVVTRRGNPVRIVCTDSPILHHPIVGFVECDLFTWTDDGKVIYGGKCEDKNDLFFADEEEELTEFEDGLFSLVSEFWQKHSLLNEEVDIAELVKENSKILLDLARNEILKDLPKWKKITKREQNYLAYGYLSNDEYYLSVKELIEKLPKEE